jgi:hypothetical protein
MPEVKTYTIQINRKIFVINSKSKKRAIIRSVIRYLKDLNFKKIKDLNLAIKIVKDGKAIKSGY